MEVCVAAIAVISAVIIISEDDPSCRLLLHGDMGDVFGDSGDDLGSSSGNSQTTTTIPFNFEITRKLYCKDCDQDVGVLMKWPQRGLKFPVIKCQKVSFWVQQQDKILARQWRNVPFIVDEYMQQLF